MAVRVLDTLGLKCPQPVLKIAVMAPEMRSGDVLEILGDCPTFEKDVRTWCERLRKAVLLQSMLRHLPRMYLTCPK
jgi:tRNA 2-thiouridine synthesizing protein A